MQVNVESRMLCCERGKTRDDRVKSKARGHAHPQQSAQITVPANAMFCLIQRREDRLYAREELGARLRRHDCTSTAREQPCAEVRLEIRDDSRRLGLRQPAL